MDPGTPSVKLRIVSRQAHERQFHRWTCMKAKAHEMGAQMDVVSFPTAGQCCPDRDDSILGGFPQVGCVAGNRIENGCGCGVRDMKISILQKYEIIRSVSTVVEATVNSIAAFKRL